MLRDNDYLNYFPLKEGKIPKSSLKTTTWSYVPPERSNVFQFDKAWKYFHENKISCSHERDEKYYRNLFKEKGLDLTPIYKFFIEKLSKVSNIKISNRNLENLAVFDGPYPLELLWSEDYDLIHPWHAYLDLFDAFAQQVQEDFVVVTYDPETGKDYISLAHLMSPSDWGAEEAIGKSFSEIHQNVKNANGKHVIQNPKGLIKGILRMPEYVERVGAISFRSTNALNRHPENRPPDIWTWDDNQDFFMRFERQVVVPFPEINSFMLIIKSYYNDLLSPERIQAAIAAFSNISPDVYHKNFCTEHGQNAHNFLLKKASQYEK